MSNHSKIIAAELAVTEKQVIATIELLDEGQQFLLFPVTGKRLQEV